MQVVLTVPSYCNDPVSQLSINSCSHNFTTVSRYVQFLDQKLKGNVHIKAYVIENLTATFDCHIVAALSSEDSNKGNEAMLFLLSSSINSIKTYGSVLSTWLPTGTVVQTGACYY